jgi:hypothetical protein
MLKELMTTQKVGAATYVLKLDSKPPSLQIKGLKMRPEGKRPLTKMLRSLRPRDQAAVYLSLGIDYP